MMQESAMRLAMRTSSRVLHVVVVTSSAISHAVAVTSHGGRRGRVRCPGRARSLSDCLAKLFLFAEFDMPLSSVF